MLFLLQVHNDRRWDEILSKFFPQEQKTVSSILKQGQNTSSPFYTGCFLPLEKKHVVWLVSCFFRYRVTLLAFRVGMLFSFTHSYDDPSMCSVVRKKGRRRRATQLADLMALEYVFYDCAQFVA